MRIISKRTLREYWIQFPDTENQLLSWYKVSKLHRCMCLFGSNVSAKKLAQLMMLNYKHIILWLDYDKYSYAQSVVGKARMLGLQTSVIVTHNDPKEYSYEDIQNAITHITPT